MPEDSRPSKSNRLSEIPGVILAQVANALAAKFPPPSVDPMQVLTEEGRAKYVRAAAHQEVIAELLSAQRIQTQRAGLEDVNGRTVRKPVDTRA